MRHTMPCPRLLTALIPLVLAMAALPADVGAQDAPPRPADASRPGQVPAVPPGPDAGRAVKISRSDCLQLLTRHHPRSDVTASSGRDVRGKPVKGADLEDWSRWSGGVEDAFTFLLYVDPFLYRRGLFPRGVTSTDIPIGVIHYDARTGDLSLDGKPINGADKAHLIRQCTEALERQR